MKADIIYNPNATGMNEEVLKSMNMILTNQGVDVFELESRYPGQAIELVKKANEDSDLLVTMGGDGTLGEAFRAFGETIQRCNYVHIATGTANDTASNLGLYQGSVYSSMKLYENLNRCMVVDVDMLTANNVPFAYVSCCGTFTNLTYETPKSFKKTFGKMGYYMFSGLIGLSCLPDVIHKPLKISYEVNGERKIIPALTMLVSNTKTFAGFELFPDARIDDGRFEVTVLKGLPGRKTLRALSELLYKDGKNFDINKYSKYIETFQTDNFKVIFESGEPRLGFNHDGDHAFVSLNDDNSLDYRVFKKVKMLLPQRATLKQFFVVSFYILIHIYDQEV